MTNNPKATTDIGRRTFLSRAWKAGLALIAVAGSWTTLDVLRSIRSSGLGGIIRAAQAADVTEVPLYIRGAQSYLTMIDGEVVALWQRCPHLGCRVAWCDSSREFECACHGSTFNRAGEVRSGPSPRGMDRFAVATDADIIEVDTGTITEGAPPGSESIDEPRTGEGCSGRAT